MTVEQVFQKIASHMIEGVMTHDELTNYYDFLGLSGMKTLHKYHAICEYIGYQKLCKHFISCHNKLIQTDKVNSQISVIPENWYNYTRVEVDGATKKSAIKSGLNMWWNWEMKTKQLYEDMYKELCDLEEYTDAEMVLSLLHDVANELKCANREYLSKKAVDYDLGYILGEQDAMHEHYKCKLKEIGKMYD